MHFTSKFPWIAAMPLATPGGAQGFPLFFGSFHESIRKIELQRIAQLLLCASSQETTICFLSFNIYVDNGVLALPVPCIETPIIRLGPKPPIRAADHIQNHMDTF